MMPISIDTASATARDLGLGLTPDARDVAVAVLRREVQEPGSWTPFAAGSLAEGLGCSEADAAAVLAEITALHAD